MSDKRKAVYLMSAAALAYAVVASIVKALAGIPVYEILFVRSFFGLIFILLLVKKQGWNREGIRAVNLFGLVARGITGFFAAMFYYASLKYVPIAEVVSITNTYPLIVILLSGLFLKEKIYPAHFAAFTLSIIGTALIINPDFSDIDLRYLEAVASALFTGVTYTILKYVKRTDTSEVIIVSFSFISTVACIPFLFSTEIIWPNPHQSLLLLLLGLMGFLYQWFVTSAFEYQPAGDVSLYSYLSIIFSLALGAAIWNEVPSFIAIIGIGCIFAGTRLIYIKKGTHLDSGP